MISRVIAKNTGDVFETQCITTDDDDDDDDVYNAESAVKATEFDQTLYQKRRLSTVNDVTVYYRVLQVDVTVLLARSMIQHTRSTFLQEYYSEMR